MQTLIIAEAGVNHNGDLRIARELIEVAAEAGADAVKFQSFHAEDVVSHLAPKAEYQLRATSEAESQLAMLRKLELSQSDHEQLFAHAMKCGIRFLSTPFDMRSLRLLVERLGVTTIKVPSGEVTNAPFLLSVARAAERVILSTGMSTIGEVEAALGVLAFGFTSGADVEPGERAFIRSFSSDEGQKALVERVTLLHCTTNYPASCDEVNLRAMQSLAAAFRLPVGYSDHTLGTHVSVAAVALGAAVIEKHFTLDRSLPGPDHAASLEPDDLRRLVREIREIERCLGDGVKRPSASEWSNRDVARRSLVAAAEIPHGGTYTRENLACKRPGTGVNPMRTWEYLGKRANQKHDVDELIG